MKSSNLLMGYSLFSGFALLIARFAGNIPKETEFPILYVWLLLLIFTALVSILEELEKRSEKP